MAARLTHIDGEIRTFFIENTCEILMRVGLFIPCYVDQLYPHVGMATVELLEHFGVEIEFPEQQTCCGQPMANTGLADCTRPLAQQFFATFRDFEYVVCPSGSCTSMVKTHYEDFFHGVPEFEPFTQRVFELTEFLTDVLKVGTITGSFPHRVGLHQSCHGLRELRLGSSSERNTPSFSKARSLLEGLRGIELTKLTRVDECCGFGGTFAVAEEAISCMMGLDRLHDHENAGSEIITGNDMSCLMHLDGLIRRQQKSMKVMHIAEILQQAIAS